MAMSILGKFNIELGNYFKPMLNGKYGVKVQVQEGEVHFSKKDSHSAVMVQKSHLIKMVAAGKEHPDYMDTRLKMINALKTLAQLCNAAPVPLSEVKPPLDEPLASGPMGTIFPPDNPSGVEILETQFADMMKAKPETLEAAVAEAAQEAQEAPKPEATPTGPVQLRDATEMYQEVRGTSQSSIYLVAALSDDLRIAVRATSSKLSVRVEGEVLKHKSALNEAGFQVNQKATDAYASIHCSTANKQIAMRTVGALLMAPGIGWTTTLPDFEKLWLQGAG